MLKNVISRILTFNDIFVLLKSFHGIILILYYYSLTGTIVNRFPDCDWDEVKNSLNQAGRDRRRFFKRTPSSL